MPTSSARRTRRGNSRWPVVLVLLVVFAGGVMAYRYFFNRPGETAIQLIPADAMMALTLDTQPSPQQVATFSRITNAIHQNKVDGQFDDMMTGTLQNSTVGKEIRPYVASSLAIAALKMSLTGRGGNEEYVAFFALKDPIQVESILAKTGQKSDQNGLTTYQFKKENISAAIIANYLVISDKPATLDRINAVRRGDVPSLASLEEYKEARAELPADANLMLFFSPTALTQMGASSKSLGVNPLQNTHWMALGTTVRDKGLDITFRIPMASSGAQSPPQIAAIDPALFSHLPSGAYGLMVFSQPGKYYDWTMKSATGDANAKKTIDDGLAEFEKQTGMNVPRDVVPGLTGQLALAVYPDSEDGKSGVDGLIVMDDANGADPVALADKIRAYAEKASAKDNKPIHFVSTQRNGGTVWALDADSEKEMKHAISDQFPSSSRDTIGGPPPALPPGGPPPAFPTPSSDPAGGKSSTMMQGNSTITINGKTIHPGKNGDFEIKEPLFPTNGSQPPSTADKYLKNKSVVYAQVGKTILLASSQKMLDRAMETYSSGKGSLADDPAYAQMKTMLPDGAQNLLMVNLQSIFNAFRAPSNPSGRSGPSGKELDDYARIFGAENTGIVGSQKYDGKVMTLQLFIPLDYEKLIQVIGKASAPPPPGGPGNPMNGAMPMNGNTSGFGNGSTGNGNFGSGNSGNNSGNDNTGNSAALDSNTGNGSNGIGNGNDTNNGNGVGNSNNGNNNGNANATPDVGNPPH